MNEEQIMSALSRLFFLGALFFLMMAITEKGLNLIGTSIPGVSVFPLQLLNWTVPPLMFVTAIILRQIREERRAGATAR